MADISVSAQTAQFTMGISDVTNSQPPKLNCSLVAVGASINCSAMQAQFLPVPPPGGINPQFAVLQSDLSNVSTSVVNNLGTATASLIAASQQGSVPYSVSQNLQQNISLFTSALEQASWIPDADAIASNNPTSISSASISMAQAQAVVNYLNSLGFTSLSAATFQQQFQLSSTQKQSLIQYIVANSTESLFLQTEEQFGVTISQYTWQPTILPALYGLNGSRARFQLVKLTSCQAIAWLVFISAITGNELAAAVGSLGYSLYC